ncbi:MAG: hypothetical protein H7Z41_15805 [Cytophagales bacterium]|nr:hypothetical protein [Armatimonadota bacterium]
MSLFNRLYTSFATLSTGLFLLAGGFFGMARPAWSQDHLLFCNNPEKIRISGVYADTLLKAGEKYTVFYHYKNVTGVSGNFVVALHGAVAKPLRFTARQGFANPQNDPPLAGRQAMARFLSSVDKSFVGKQGAGRFTHRVGDRNVVSGVLSVQCDQPTRLRLYFRHDKWTVPGARVIAVATPRREVEIALSTASDRKSFRIGQPEAGMNRRLDGTYGMLYAFKIAAPQGRRVRVSFSPRGGKGGLVGSVNGDLRQSNIVPAAQWRVFFEQSMGKRGLNLTTAPFGGVFYPVELVFQLI